MPSANGRTARAAARVPNPAIRCTGSLRGVRGGSSAMVRPRSSSQRPPTPLSPERDDGSPGAREEAGRMRGWLKILVGVGTLLAIVGMFAVWANRLLLNPDKF